MVVLIEVMATLPPDDLLWYCHVSAVPSVSVNFQKTCTNTDELINAILSILNL